MGINNCTEKFIDNSSFTRKIGELYASQKRSDRILGRFGNIVLIPAALITAALDALICLGVGLGALCTLGMKKSLIERFIVHADGITKILAKPYSKLLIAVSSSKPDWDNNKNFFGKITKPFYYKVNELAYSKGFFKREVVSRLAISLLAVAMIIINIFNIVIGIACAPISLLLRGKSTAINTLALNGLCGIGLIGVIILFPTMLINPRSVCSKD